MNQPYICWGSLHLQDKDMERINGVPLYWLGYSLGSFTSKLSLSIAVSSIAAHAAYASNNLDFFINHIQALPLSRIAAETLKNTIDNLISSERLQQNDLINENDISMLNYNIVNFQAILGSELPQANFFYITPKRAYDMNILINKGENVLSPDIISCIVPKEIFINDIREATKSLAFNIPTAVGFHVYRALETIVKEYFIVVGIKTEEWEKNRNLGKYIELLEKYNVEKKITTMLRHLKDNYRNPISHPEEFWDLDKAESAFQLAISVISVMVQDIEERKKKTNP